MVQDTAEEEKIASYLIRIKDGILTEACPENIEYLAESLMSSSVYYSRPNKAKANIFLALISSIFLVLHDTSNKQKYFEKEHNQQS